MGAIAPVSRPVSDLWLLGAVVHDQDGKTANQPKLELDSDGLFSFVAHVCEGPSEHFEVRTGSFISTQIECLS